jgi:copper resistance protein C
VKLVSPGAAVPALARVGASAVIFAAVVLADPPIASAHNWVIATSPPSSTTVTTAPSQVTTTFNEAPQALNSLYVVGPDGKQWSTGSSQMTGATGSVAMLPSPPPGIYKVNYVITASDGDGQSGSWTFTLAAPGSHG